MVFPPGRTPRALAVALAVLLWSAPAAGQTVNQPPQCPPEGTATATSGQPLTLPSQPCPDPEGQPVTLILVEGPHNGTLAGLTYTSNAGFVGTDTIRYKASDGTSESPVATLTIRVVAQGGGGGLAAGKIQQQVEAGAMLPGDRLPIWIYVKELSASQEVQVRIEATEPLQRVDPACAPDGATYLCTIRSGARNSTTTLRFDLVAGAPGRYTLTSRIVHSGASDTEVIEVLPPPVAGRSVAVVDVGSCTQGKPVSARLRGETGFKSICPGRTLPVGSQVRVPPRAPDVHWTRGGRVYSAQIISGEATLAQPGGGPLEFRLAKPPGCRGFKSISVNTRAPMRIVGRLVTLTFKRANLGVREYCDRARIGLSGTTVTIRDHVHGRTTRVTVREHRFIHVRR